MCDRLPLNEYAESPSHNSSRQLDQSDGKSGQNEPAPRRTSHGETPSPTRSKTPLKSKQTTSNYLDSRRIDYVLVHEAMCLDEVVRASDKKDLEMRLDYRERFMTALHSENIEVQKERIGKYIYLKLHAPFERLCKEAASVNLEMPLKGCEIYDDDMPGCWARFEEKHLETDTEVDFVSAPFQNDKKQIYEGIGTPATFFRPAQRSFLVNHILINIDVRKIDQNAKDEAPLARKGLPWMLHRSIFCDSFIMHDESLKDPAEQEELEEKLAANGDDQTKVDTMLEDKELVMPDTRRELHDTWARFRIKYQPLWKIRNYFGEKIALYFAWSGTMTTTLWIPTIFGIAVFFYGLYLSIANRADLADPSNNLTTTTPPINETENEALIREVKMAVENSLETIKEAFDNAVTPFFALVICLWGTVFLEIWKRKNSTLAYEWDVDGFEDMEPDRPQFYGTEKRPDPVTLEATWYYPLKKQLMKYATSSSVLLVMVVMVFISAAAVILYRVLMTVDYCTKVNGTTCLLISTVASTVLNAVSILILGKLYDWLAVLLTNWENHRTQTQYDDGLILKLFAFQFANSYTSLFYIAFFRKDDWANGLFGLGEQYQDGCTGSGCMSMLSLQVLVLMLMKPLPKFLKDIVLTWLMKKWKKRRWCRRSRKTDPNYEGKVILNSYMKREHLKADLGDFTLGEYTEKVIVYGFLMLFAASFPLAPLIALLIGLIDIRIDAYRMLWMNRRPLARVAQDIGMWFNILRFLNIAGVISNGFLIAFTSTWGRKYDLVGKLWIVIIFEHGVFGVRLLLQMWLPDVPKVIALSKRRHVVFAIKLILDIAIPDVPRPIKLAMKREKYQIGRILDRATQEMYSEEGKKFSFLSPATLLRNKSQMKVEKKYLGYLDGRDVALPRSGPEKSEHRVPTNSVVLTSETSDPHIHKRKKSKKKKQHKNDASSDTDTTSLRDLNASQGVSPTQPKLDVPGTYAKPEDIPTTPRPSRKYLSPVVERHRKSYSNIVDMSIEEPFYTQDDRASAYTLSSGSGSLIYDQGGMTFNGDNAMHVDLEPKKRGERIIISFPAIHPRTPDNVAASKTDTQ